MRYYITQVVYWWWIWDISYLHNFGKAMNKPSAALFGIAGPVFAFMRLVSDILDRFGKAPDFFKQMKPEHRMFLYFKPFMLLKSRFFQDNFSWNTQHADIVQKRAHADFDYLLFAIAI